VATEGKGDRFVGNRPGIFFGQDTFFTFVCFFCWLVLGKFCENLPFVHTLLVYLEIVFLHVHLSEVISQCVCCKTNYTVA